MENYSNKKELIENLLRNYLNLEIDEQEKLGIPDNGYIYHNIGEHQNRGEEFLKTEEFLNWVVVNHPKEFNDVFNINFINYGDTELVYVIDELGYKRTLLVGQPNVEFGTVKKEYENLNMLAKRNPDLIVCPTNYFSNGYREAFLTPYIYQARCIASSELGYGAYVPNPSYRFDLYNTEDTYTICKAMIANLVMLYNQDENLGLAACKIGGGDFILEKEYDEEPHTIENTLKRMHLIAARELISIDFSSYIHLLENEFRRITYYKKIEEKDPNILINHKNRIPISKETIEDGIQLGLKLRR